MNIADGITYPDSSYKWSYFKKGGLFSLRNSLRMIAGCQIILAKSEMVCWFTEFAAFFYFVSWGREGPNTESLVREIYPW